MKHLMSAIAGLSLLALAAGPAGAGKAAGDYLTEDGKLKYELEIRDVQGGFAGFTGTAVKIEPGGGWTRYQVFKGRLTPKGKGKLSAAQLKSLAEDLARYDALHLKDKADVPMANPRVVTVQFGNHKAEMHLQAGAPLPKPPANPPGSVAERYGGVVAAVQALTNKVEKNE
jgi:hypothetical protein